MSRSHKCYCFNNFTVNIFLFILYFKNNSKSEVLDTPENREAMPKEDFTKWTNPS